MSNVLVTTDRKEVEGTRELSYGTFYSIKSVSIGTPDRIAMRTQEMQIFSEQFRAIVGAPEIQSLAGVSTYLSDIEKRKLSGFLEKMVSSGETPVRGILWSDIREQASENLSKEYQSVRRIFKNLAKPAQNQKLRNYLGGETSDKIINFVQSVERRTFPDLERGNVVPTELNWVSGGIQNLLKLYKKLDERVSKKASRPVTERVHQFLFGEENSIQYLAQKHLLPFFEKRRKVESMRYVTAFKEEIKQGRTSSEILGNGFFRKYGLAPDRKFMNDEVIPLAGKNDVALFNHYVSNLGLQTSKLHPIATGKECAIAQKYLTLGEGFSDLRDGLEDVLTRLISPKNSINLLANFLVFNPAMKKRFVQKHSLDWDKLFIEFRPEEGWKTRYSLKDFWQEFCSLTIDLGALREKFNLVEGREDRIHYDLVQKTLGAYGNIRDVLTKLKGFVTYGVDSGAGYRQSAHLTDRLEKIRERVCSLEKGLYEDISSN